MLPMSSNDAHEDLFELTPPEPKRKRNNKEEYREQCALIAWARWTSQLIQNIDQQKSDALFWLHSIPNEHYFGQDSKLGKAMGAHLVASGLTAGVLDLFLPYRTKEYGGFYIEMKSKTGYLKPKQKLFKAMAERNGYFTGKFKKWQEAARAIMRYLDLDPKLCGPIADY